jgi:hypothetical protein
LSSPLAILTLRAGYLLPAFAFLAPDLVVPDRLDPDFVEPDFDFWVDFELDRDLLRELGVDLGADFALPDLELLERDFELLDRDLELLEPDFEPLEPDLDLLEPDFELRPRELELAESPVLAPDSESVVGGSGGRAAGSTCLLRSSVPLSSGGGSLRALSAPITSGTAP